MLDADLAAFHQAHHDDELALKAGTLTHEQFWARAHGRDAQVRAMSPADRLQANTTGSHCGCSHCLAHPQ